MDSRQPENFAQLLRTNLSRMLAGMLRLFAAITLATAVLLILVPSIIPEGRILEPVLRNLIPFGIALFLLHLLSRGYVLAVVWIMIATTFVVTPYAIYREGAQNLHLLALLAFPVVLAGVLPNRPQFWGVFGLTAAISMVTFWALIEYRGAQIELRGILAHLLSMTLFAILVDGLSQAYRNSMVESWQRYTDLNLSRQSLAEANRHLQETAAQRDRADEKLHEQEMIERLALEAVGAGTWKHDFRTGRTVWNETQWRLLGMAQQTKPPNLEEHLIMVHPDDRDRLRESVAAVAEQRNNHHEVTYRVFLPDGSIRWIMSVGEFLEGPDGNPAYFTGVTLDVTARMEEERRRAESEAHSRESQRLESLGLLAGGIAHDFNNLLLAIMGNADLARMRLASGSEEEKFLGVVLTASQRASELCNELLAYSGKGKVLIRPFRLDELVREMGRLIEVTLPKGVELYTEFSPSTPTVECDVAQIQQVVLNLITNAADALRGMQGTIRIQTGREDAGPAGLREYQLAEGLASGEYAFLRIEDTGCGMDEATLRKLFDPFFTTKEQGRGLGMAAVLGIVRGHSGAIRVDSTPGKGTRFSVLLPISDSAPESLARGGSADAAAAGTGTILVVDDEPTIRMLAVDVLSSAGYAVVEASDGLEGVDAYRSNYQRLAAVLLDLTMPRMNGIEALDRMREIDASVPVVVSTGYDKSELLMGGDQRGIRHFLQKPYLPRDLLRAIGGAIADDGRQSK